MSPSTEPGVNGAPTDHNRSQTLISMTPSETATLAASSTFATVSKAKPLDGLPDVRPLPPFDIGNTSGSPIPNVTVPPEHKNRTLVLCFDGTGDQFDNDNSNIVELFSILKKDDPDKQLVYYQAGIGTYTVPQIATPFMAKFSKALDEAVAWNIDAHIMGGYEFLMQNYKAGDKICIFGFSRGAYTARCLAGMIHKVGLLPACNHQQVPFAYKMYTTTDAVGWKQSNAFKAAFSNPVAIDFLGVWDTVSSVGIIPRHLPFTTSNTVVRVFRHAISLDERRAKFKQNCWNRPTETEAQLAATDRVHREIQKHSHGNGHDSGKKKVKELEAEYSAKGEIPTDIEEVWFAGCHCDVGGGSVSNGTRPSLSRIPLRWMIRQMFLTETGIMLSAPGLRRIGLDLDPNTFYPILKRPPPLTCPENVFIQNIPPPKPLTDEELEAQIKQSAFAEAHLSEEELELRDALSPIYDQLSLAPGWWILELLPLRHKYQNEDNSWVSWLGWNMGQGRHIPGQSKRRVKVHRSVRTRIEAGHADGTKYSPKANLRLDEVTWVD